MSNREDAAELDGPNSVRLGSRSGRAWRLAIGVLYAVVVVVPLDLAAVSDLEGLDASVGAAWLVASLLAGVAAGRAVARAWIFAVPIVCVLPVGVVGAVAQNYENGAWYISVLTSMLIQLAALGFGNALVNRRESSKTDRRSEIP